MTAPITTVLEHLKGLDHREKLKKITEVGWVACCPAHEDDRPSLSVSIGEQQRVLLRCHAGCDIGDIVAGMGLTMADLFEPKAEQTSRRRDTSAPPRIIATYDYQDADGTLLYQVVRYEPKDFRMRRRDGGGDWNWHLNGTPRVLYRLPELVAADPAVPVFVTEGEKDVDRLLKLGLVATTNPNGVGKWRPEYSQHFTGRKVVILPDNDEPGEKHAADVAGQIDGIAESITIVKLPGLPAKGDVSDWLTAGHTVAELLALAAPQPSQSTGLAAALAAYEAHLRRFVYFTDEHQPVAVTLYAPLTHRVDRAEQVPVLAVMSPVRRSGKTKLLDVQEHVVARPWRVIRPSESVLFRKIERDTPTLMMDEVDTIFNAKTEHEGVRAVLNAGNRPGTTVARVVAKGKGFDLQDFRIFGAKIVAGIGDLPETVRDRAIVIQMSRKAPSDAVGRLRQRDAQRLGQPIRDAFAAAMANVGTLTLDGSRLPADLDDRAQDSWEPLIAIADLAGGDWPARARAAAVALSRGRSDVDDDGLPLVLLADARTAFAAEPSLPRLTTSQLIERLVAIELSPWGDMHGKQVTGRKVAKLLRPFGIAPVRERVGTVYAASDFADAWLRYLPPESAATAATATDTPEPEPAAAYETAPVADVADVADFQRENRVRICPGCDHPHPVLTTCRECPECHPVEMMA